jgi:hypothetical protein
LKSISQPNYHIENALHNRFLNRTGSFNDYLQIAVEGRQPVAENAKTCSQQTPVRKSGKTNRTGYL